LVKIFLKKKLKKEEEVNFGEKKHVKQKKAKNKICGESYSTFPKSFRVYIYEKKS
jgi:hypothetical protein